MTLTGTIRVPADLDAVTTVGDEDVSDVDPAAVERIWELTRHWYGAGLQPAIQVCLRHNGKVFLNRAIGHAWGNAPDDPPDAEQILVTPSTPYCVYSAAKGITTTVMHMLAERGAFELDDRVCDYLPGYTSHGKDRTTIRHVLTHSAGVPFSTGAQPDPRRMDDSDYVREQLNLLRPLYPPGLMHIYHAVTFGLLTREIVSAATGKGIREILAEEVLDPLGFRWTNYGVAQSDVEQVAPSHPTGAPLPAPVAAVFRKAIGGTTHEVIPRTNKAGFLTGVLPSSNTVSNAQELSRFADIWCHGGELDGVRVLSPDTLREATRPVRGLIPNVATQFLPMRWGTGFALGSRYRGLFGADAPAAFGNTGLVNIAFWADPQRSLAAAIVSSGKPGRDPESKRYRALVDAIAREIPLNTGLSR